MQAEAANKEAFMNECLQERKQYECTAMWRSGKKPERSTTVVPMYMPMGR